MNWSPGVSLPSFSNSTTRLILLIFRLLPSISPSSRLSFPSCLPTTTNTPISTVHVHSHPICPPPSLRPLLQPPRPLHFQPPSKISFHLTVRFPRFRTLYRVRVGPPSRLRLVTDPALRLAQSSPFNRSPQSSPSRTIANDSPDDFQTNAASFIAPTPSAQSDSTTPPNVYINGLPPNFPEEQLYNMTKEFGTVLSVRTFTRHVSERPT